MKATLSETELRSVAQLIRFASTSHPDLQFVCADTDGDQLLWTATDQRCLATLRVGSWDGEAAVIALPLRELKLVSEICELRRAHQVEIEVADHSGVVRFPGLTLPFAGAVTTSSIYSGRLRS